MNGPSMKRTCNCVCFFRSWWQTVGWDVVGRIFTVRSSPHIGCHSVLCLP